MYHKSKKFRIHQNERIIKKRKKIAKIIGIFFKKEGKLRKHNMSCNCGMCSYKHPQGVKKAQDSFKVKEKKRIQKEEINETFYDSNSTK